MSHLYIHRPHARNAANLKVVNDQGVELSVAFNDSAGAMQHLGRVSLARFTGPKFSQMIGEEQYHVTAEDLLEALAGHLGYEVRRKEAP